MGLVRWILGLFRPRHCERLLIYVRGEAWELKTRGGGMELMSVGREVMAWRLGERRMLVIPEGMSLTRLEKGCQESQTAEEVFRAQTGHSLKSGEA